MKEALIRDQRNTETEHKIKPESGEWTSPGPPPNFQIPTAVFYIC